MHTQPLVTPSLALLTNLAWCACDDSGCSCMYKHQATLCAQSSAIGMRQKRSRPLCCQPLILFFLTSGRLCAFNYELEAALSEQRRLPTFGCANAAAEVPKCVTAALPLACTLHCSNPTAVVCSLAGFWDHNCSASMHSSWTGGPVICCSHSICK